MPNSIIPRSSVSTHAASASENTAPASPSGIKQSRFSAKFGALRTSLLSRDSKSPTPLGIGQGASVARSNTNLTDKLEHRVRHELTQLDRFMHNHADLIKHLDGLVEELQKSKLEWKSKAASGEIFAGTFELKTFHIDAQINRIQFTQASQKRLTASSSTAVNPPSADSAALKKAHSVASHMARYVEEFKFAQDQMHMLRTVAALDEDSDDEDEDAIDIAQLNAQFSHSTKEMLDDLQHTIDLLRQQPKDDPKASFQPHSRADVFAADRKTIIKQTTESSLDKAKNLMQKLSIANVLDRR